MPYFKDKSHNPHFLERAEDAHLLPDGCIPITDAEALAIQSPTVEQVKTSCLAAINNHASRKLALLSAAYPDGEVQSWSQQTREADALAVNPDVATPLLSAIATTRGVPLADLATRVRAKVQAYAVASGQIIGQRQALEDAINAVDLSEPDAAAQLKAVQWSD